MNRKSVLLLIIFIVSGIIYYFGVDKFSLTGNSIKMIESKVIRVVDGDTIEIENGDKVRFLGINTPEKKELYSDEAQNFTKQIENKTVKIETPGRDKYNRNLGYVFYNGKLINEEIIRNGLAHVYIYENDKYSERLRSAEKIAREKEIGIWKKSANYGCIEVVQLKYKEDGKRCTNREQLILKNSCKSLNITIKDDATHIYHEKINTGIFTKNFSCIFNDEGDSLFIWDETGLLVFERY